MYDLYAHAQTVDTKRSSPIFQAPGYEARQPSTLFESEDRVTRQTTSDRKQDVQCLHVGDWYECSYIAGIPLLAPAMVGL